MLAFDRSEYETRLERTKTSMQESGIEVLLCHDTANMHYLTGYDGWSFYTPQCVVVALELEEPLWIGRGIDGNGARATTYLREENIYPYGDDYVQTAAKHPMNFAADVLKARGLDRGTIGLEMDSYYFSPAGYEALLNDLPNATFVNGEALVNWVRCIKSPAEIALMQQAAKILDRVMEVAFEQVTPGNRQCDAAAAIYQAGISGTPEFGGDYTAIVPMLPTGPGTATPHLTWSDEVFKEGEATILELAGCRKRYHCPQARTVFLGKPPQMLADAASWVVEGIDAAFNFVKPGVTAEEVERVWRDTIAKHGLIKESRCGYSTGLNYPPDWGEHTISLRPGDTTVLQPNMTIHFMPGIWMDDWGIEISECFRVTEDGCEPLASTPRELIVKS